MDQSSEPIYAYLQSEVERITPTDSGPVEETRNLIARAIGIRPFVQRVKVGPRDPYRTVVVHFTEEEFERLGEWLRNHPRREWF